MACCKTYLSLCTERGEVSEEVDKVPGWREVPGAGGEQVSKSTALFYFCTVVPLILYYKKAASCMPQSILQITRKFSMEHLLYWKIKL